MDSPVTKPWNTAKFCNIAGALRWQAERQPGTTAVQYTDTRRVGARKTSSYSYIELNELTDAYARGLSELGLAPGDRAMILGESGIFFFTLFTALAKVGAVPVVVAADASPDTLKQCFDQTSPKAFIGSSRANFQRKMKGWGKPDCNIAISTGRGIPGVATGIKALFKLGMSGGREVFHNSRPDEIAAINFTAGVGGKPKAVVHTHGEFSAQSETLRQTFDITPGEVSLTTLPLLSVFDAALGMASVFLDIDSSQPGQADAKRLVQAIETHKVSNVFLSSAMLETLSHYIKEENVNMPLVRRLVVCGASPRLETIARAENALHDEARIHVSYGSAECFPVSDITNHDVDSVLEEMMESGEGVCVGKPVSSVRIKIVAPGDSGYKSLNSTPVLPPGIVGEIIVSGPHCSTTYCDPELNDSKISGENGETWHRMGDMGSLDGMGRLWYCGRVSQQIDTGQESLYPDQAEALFNQHPDARHTALVGVGPEGNQMPVLCIELRHKLRPADIERVHFDLLQLAQSCALTRSVRTVLFHPGFPKDPSDSAAIPRAALAEWAAGKVKV